MNMKLRTTGIVLLVAVSTATAVEIGPFTSWDDLTKKSPDRAMSRFSWCFAAVLRMSTGSCRKTQRRRKDWRRDSKDEGSNNSHPYERETQYLAARASSPRYSRRRTGQSGRRRDITESRASAVYDNFPSIAARLKT